MKIEIPTKIDNSKVWGEYNDLVETVKSQSTGAYLEHKKWIKELNPSLFNSEGFERLLQKRKSALEVFIATRKKHYNNVSQEARPFIQAVQSPSNFQLIL